ncbi:NADPH:quinone reductase-like Zn-dependent oxidoreductase [Allocatelliglobosispora scoriae]|uniref:NADPH:quinone reductase-like Zn-dependent oxidoreductase n=1 Tax=Allocatelliglobosispora scoriae TaxID=643052 RepID=A0A841C522_9ACTN|nr:NADP-dependent oxidoreductase [Allocatelliglobosispora scoriae]MBB5874243.1 NADPH:quinone reductase-like Zn-dependent oxidoreductase [Allocatelliglobosispora scoriae]
MKAIRVHRQGAPDVLTYEEVPRPVPGRGEVLVRVHAAGINPPDWYARRGLANIPAELRPEITFPFTPGSDISGVVAETGAGVTEFAVGDEVFGLLFRLTPGVMNGGKAYAEYATAPVTALARKPVSVDHVQAAAVPMAGLTAYQYLWEILKPDPGATVLVNGAAGGVGHFAAQLAKVRGARVIGVASTRHEAFLAELGVDRFVDYTATAVTEAVRDVDVVIDTVGGPHGHRFLDVLAPGGVLSPVFFGDYHRDRAAELGIAVVGGQVRSDGAGLAELARLIDAGRVRIGIDSVFDLADAAAAHERAERGHIQGKIVLRVR